MGAKLSKWSTCCHDAPHVQKVTNTLLRQHTSAIYWWRIGHLTADVRCNALFCASYFEERPKEFIFVIVCVRECVEGSNRRMKIVQWESPSAVREQALPQKPSCILSPMSTEDRSVRDIKSNIGEHIGTKIVSPLANQIAPLIFLTERIVFDKILSRSIVPHWVAKCFGGNCRTVKILDADFDRLDSSTMLYELSRLM